MRRALIISHGDLTTFVTRPISLAFLIITVIALGLALTPRIRRKREVVFQEEPV
jgi:TctA family transporter